MALHMLYGTGAGGAFGVLTGVVGLGVASLTGALLWAVAYAVVLTLVGMIFWMRVVLAMEPQPGMVARFGFFHLVYGLVLGAGVTYIPL
jgi:hypothetical protein